jgi:hypothetical protein
VIPKKPFDTYKWRWLSFQPSEGLLKAPVFLGVLRALQRFEGSPFSSPALRDELQVVGDETSSSVTLGRDDPDRNLFRNSGQYWRGTGLLRPVSGGIQLTPLGRRVANGQITQGEFAAVMIQQTTLPNPWTYRPQEMENWQAADLEIKPLKLILEVIERLGAEHGDPQAYLTNNELVGVVVPLAGERTPPNNIARHVSRYRRGTLNVSDWPDCAPGANDERLTREFLLFLSSFGILRHDPEGSRDEQRFYMDEAFNVDEAIAPIQDSIFKDDASAEQAVDEIIHSPLPSIVERQRTLTTASTRRGQAQFRTLVLRMYGGRCWLTNEAIPEVLEAAHIVPVEYQGSDEANNGLCLRVDVHRLYDSGHVRIRSNGDVALSDVAKKSVSYSALPQKVTFPPFLNPANIAWRNEYY